MNRSESKDTHDPLSALSRAAARVGQRTEHSLSPWVQRALSRGGLFRDIAVTATTGTAGAAAQRSTAIFERVQRASTRGNVWSHRAESLSAQAQATDNFSGAVIQRFPDTSAKYERQPTGSPLSRAN